MKKILIQPTINTYDDYKAFAKNKGISFEIIDFAFPEVLDSDYQHIIRKYKSNQNSNQQEIIGQHGAFLDLCITSRDKSIKDVSEKRFNQNLQISDSLDINYTIFHSGIISLIGHKYYYDDWVKQNISFWTKTITDFKTTVLIENLWDQTPEHLFEVVNNVNSEKLKICFDTGHHNIFSNVSMKEWFRILGNYIPYIHLNDNLGDVDSELPPGKGNINWKEFNFLVNEFCNNPIIVFEVGNLEMIYSTFDYLEKNKIYPLN